VLGVVGLDHPMMAPDALPRCRPSDLQPEEARLQPVEARPVSRVRYTTMAVDLATPKGEVVPLRAPVQRMVADAPVEDLEVQATA
jgi:hypothetical protein